ncbi:MAG: FAD-binding protein [Bacteroidia bacterium]|nr:FAD-binding protein [Bacteroidia bacterium]
MNKQKIICVGAGLAAINFIRHLPKEIELVWVLNEGYQKSNSYLAKGGVAVSFPGDVESHIEDTLVAGASACDEQLVREVIGASEQVFTSMKKSGILFDEEALQEGGHSQARIQHVSDQTGKFVIEHLWQEVLKRRNTRLLFNYCASDILCENNAFKGLQLSHRITGEQMLVYGSALVLATGGVGNLYSMNTNAITVNGSALGMAIRAGLKTKNLEFVQFHPTKLYSPYNSSQVLVTEAFRGAGAVLVSESGYAFMDDIHPLASLAPRDIVALGMFNQMKKDGVLHVYLDYSALSDDEFQTKFPYLFQQARRSTWHKNKRMPVAPAAHYLCGGLKVNANCKTSMLGVYAIGEVACTGLHGANRLASNSLLELFYFSEKLAKNISDDIQVIEEKDTILESLSPVSQLDLAKYEKQMQCIMWQNFGIVRTSSGMHAGLSKLQELEFQLCMLAEASIPYRRLFNSLQAAICIAKSAYNRKQSLGCHVVKQDNVCAL